MADDATRVAVKAKVVQELLKNPKKNTKVDFLELLAVQCQSTDSLATLGAVFGSERRLGGEDNKILMLKKIPQTTTDKHDQNLILMKYTG